MKKYLAFAVTLILALCISFTAYAHPGSLDKNGGHYNRQTGEYHYHDGDHTINPTPKPSPTPQTFTNNQATTNSNSSIIRNLVEIVIGTLLLGVIMWSWFILAEIYISSFIKSKHKNFNENQFLSLDSTSSNRALKVCMFFSFFTSLAMSVAREDYARYPFWCGIFAVGYILFLDYKAMISSLSDKPTVKTALVEPSPIIIIDEIPDQPVSIINECSPSSEPDYNIEHTSVNDNVVDPYRVYWTPNGKTFHSTDKCITLRKSPVINKGMMAEAFSNGCTKPCGKCVGENYKIK